MNWGYGLWAAMESMNAADAEATAKKVLRDLEDVSKRYMDFTFAARSHVHGLRSRCRAHEAVEDMLISALKAENANHPLASKEAVEALVDEEQKKKLFDPAVIKETYPDGKLPEGAVVDGNKVWTIK